MPIHVEEQLAVEAGSSRPFVPHSSAALLERLSQPLRGPRVRISATRTLRDILIVLAVAMAVRLPYFRGRMFPLNDGGMFAQMVDDLRAAHFRLPSHITYNFLHIPFSYPPLAFYLGALCTLLPGQTAVSVLVWLPLCLNLAGAVVLYFIARELYPSPFYAWLAATCYVVIGRSSEWLIMGGGLTRAPGVVCACMAILLFLRSRNQARMALAAWSGFWTGVAFLFHLEGAVFAALSLTVLAALLPDRRRNVHRVFVAGAVSIAVISPWLWWLHAHLGFGPLLDAAHTGGPYERILGPYTLVILVGSFVLAMAARFPYVCWLAIVPIVMRRSPSTYGALVGGLCLVWVANAILVLLVRWRDAQSRWRAPVLAAIALGMAISINGIPQVHADRLQDLEKNSRAQLSPLELDGMHAAAQLTPPDARFLVFNQRFGAWPTDMVAEWFPYFAQRHCVNTVQGTEWLPNLAFYAARKREENLDLAGSERFATLMIDGFKPDYIFIAGPLDENQGWLAAILRKYANSAAIYSNAEVTIYPVKRNASPPPSTR